MLISPINIEEVLETIKGEPDIIDIKNPIEGSLGANFPWLISQTHLKIQERNSKNEILGIKKKIELSAAIGDFPFLPGSASLAALGAAVSGVNYVKIGMMGPKDKEMGIMMAKSVVRAVKDYNPEIKTVIAGYADQHLLNKSIDPMLIPEITYESGADVAMIDTAIKNGRSLFDHLPFLKIMEFKEIANSNNIEIALAGSLKFADLDKLSKLDPEIIGVRSMVCENFDRVKGRIKSELILKLKAKLEI